MTTQPTQIRREFTNSYGERWELRIDVENEVGELRGDELGDSLVPIVDDEIQSDLMLSADEAAWLSECWSRRRSAPRGKSAGRDSLLAPAMPSPRPGYRSCSTGCA